MLPDRETELEGDLLDASKALQGIAEILGVQREIPMTPAGWVELVARVQLIRQQLDQTRAAVVGQDPLPNLERYSSVPLPEAVRLALKERFDAAVYWQKSSHKLSDEIRTLVTAIGALNEAKEAVINSHAE